MAYLNDHPPAQRQFIHPRRSAPTGAQVIHTAEVPPDTTGPDTGNDKVAAFIVRRDTPGSYHTLSDSDSILQLVEYGDEAFHDGTGGNRWSIGHSIATQAAAWPGLPSEWVDAAVANIAKAAATATFWLVAHGHPATPAARITNDQYRTGRAGFIGHGEIDPGRRSDPGAAFPWDRFLSIYSRLITPPSEAPEMFTLPIPAYVDLAYAAAERPPDNDPKGRLYWVEQIAQADDPWAKAREMKSLLGI